MPTEFMSDFLGASSRPVETAIRDKLTASLQPQLLQVINESHMHAVPKNSETHFKVPCYGFFHAYEKLHVVGLEKLLY